MDWFSISLYGVSLLAIPGLACSMAARPSSRTVGYGYVTVAVCLLMFAGLLATLGPGDQDDWVQSLVIVSVLGYMPFAGVAFLCKGLCKKFADTVQMLRPSNWEFSSQVRPPRQ